MKKVYFISDMHLGATYLPDRRAHEQRVVRFLDSIADDADELYMLGDVLDYWYEYRTVVPRGYVRFFGALARLADSGVRITWFIGNHDIWLFDYLRNEIGVDVVDGSLVREILGKKFFLSHGDGVGRMPFSFRFMRGIFRNKVAQWFYSAVHPRWTIPFALKWSAHSRDFVNDAPAFQGFRDEPLCRFAREYLADEDGSIDYFVFGHRHILIDEPVPGTDARIIILGDWIRLFSYGVFDGRDFQLKCFE